MLAQGESGPVLCFVCQTDLTSLQLRQRTTHVEQCLGLPDYEANEVPRDTLGGASAPIEIPDEELSDFKAVGGGARKVVNSTTKRPGTTLTMLWNLPAGKAETTMAKLAPATEPSSLPVAPTPVTLPLPSLPSFQLPDHVRAKFQQTRLQHLHQSTRRQVTGPETETSSSNASAKPVTSTRRGGARQQVKSTNTRPDPELDLALALSASLSRQNSTPNKTRSAATGKLRRSKSAKISAAVKGGATRSEAKEKPFSITGDCDDGNEKRDAAAVKPAATGKRKARGGDSLTDTPCSVWPVQAAQQVGQQNLVLLTRTDSLRLGGDGKFRRTVTHYGFPPSRLSARLVPAAADSAITVGHICSCPTETLWTKANSCYPYSLFSPHPSGSAADTDEPCPAGNPACPRRHPYMCTFLRALSTP